MKFIMPFVLIVSAALCSTAAQALIVTVNPVSTAPASTFTTLGVLNGTGVQNAVGDVSGAAWTAWRGTAYTDSRPYNYISSGNITYNFGRLIKSFTFIWGSPSEGNTLVLGGVNGTFASLVAGQGLAAQITTLSGGVGSLVTITASNSSEYFNSVKFETVGPPFEYATISVSPVPVPPALLLFGSSLLGLFGLSRRRKKLVA